jgi:EAL domain-containing protein (putative c-di-GMP-specific phosphodiesterase class I)
VTYMPLHDVAGPMAHGRIDLAVQDVRSILKSDETLYKECLATLIDTDGIAHGASEFIPHLENSGRLPILDRHVLDLTLDRLEAYPEALLGCNLSASNLDSVESWDHIVQRIAARPHLVRRLILEITESRDFADVGLAREMLAKTRSLGCMVAIDDFGAGYATEDRLSAIKADIVKLDATFVRGHRTKLACGSTKLDYMVAAALRAAPIVVVEGVETVEEYRAASLAGATHVQGYLFSRPVLLSSQLC